MGVLKEQEVVIAGPMGVQHLRTFKNMLKEFAAKVRAASMISNAPGVYTGFVDQLQQTFPQWYNNVYSESNPPVGCPQHLLLTVKKMQMSMGCRSSKTGCQLGKASDSMSMAMQMLLNMQSNSQQQMENPIPGLVVYPPRRLQSGNSLGLEGQGLPGLQAPLASAPLALLPPPGSAVPGPTETLPASIGALALPPPKPGQQDASKACLAHRMQLASMWLPCRKS